jgi:hypothetical protein
MRTQYTKYHFMSYEDRHTISESSFFVLSKQWFWWHKLCPCSVGYFNIWNCNLQELTLTVLLCTFLYLYTNTYWGSSLKDKFFFFLFFAIRFRSLGRACSEPRWWSYHFLPGLPTFLFPRTLYYITLLGCLLFFPHGLSIAFYTCQHPLLLAIASSGIHDFQAIINSWYGIHFYTVGLYVLCRRFSVTSPVSQTNVVPRSHSGKSDPTDGYIYWLILNKCCTNAKNNSTLMLVWRVLRRPQGYTLLSNG